MSTAVVDKGILPTNVNHRWKHNYARGLLFIVIGSTLDSVTFLKYRPL